MIRRPAVAGQFYPAEPSMLDAQVRECLDLSVKRKEDALGCVCPHAGYMYSGKVAGAVYSRISVPETVVILGPNHTGWGGDFSIMTEGVWNMPFGDARIDSAIAKDIFKNSRFMSEDIMAHQREHSVEVQLPFLQYYSKTFQFVPIAVKHYVPEEGYLKMCSDVANAIASALSKLKSKFTIIASTDFTHYESQKRAEENDNAAINAILDLDAKRLFEEVNNRDISMCGYGPVAITIMACKKLGAKKAELVKYMTSGDTTRDYSEVVGYAGLIIR